MTWLSFVTCLTAIWDSNPQSTCWRKFVEKRKVRSSVFLTLRIPLSSLASSLLCLITYLTFGLAEMATRYSKEKYAHIRGLKNEPLSNLATDLKKRKLSEKKGEAVALPFVQVAPSSPTLSLEVTAYTPLTIVQKEKAKLEGASGTTLQLLWVVLTTWSQMTNSRACHLFLLTSWSVTIFTNWCRYAPFSSLASFCTYS